MEPRKPPATRVKKALPLCNILLAFTLTGGGCAHDTSQPAAEPRQEPFSVADTLRGTVAVVGADPGSLVTLRLQDPDAEVFLQGAELPALKRVQGAEVWIAGRKTGEQSFLVVAFEVRSVDGVATVDGILTGIPGDLVLLTSDGRRLGVRQPGPELPNHTGARVWIAGPLEEAPVAWGIIRPAPGRQ